MKVSKVQKLLDPNPELQPYPAGLFAEKHGLSLKAAEIILYTNGPSQIACDAVARAFLAALALRARH